MSGLSPNALGAVYMTLGSLAYVINDAFVRLATEDGLGVYQVLCLRGIAMAVLFALVGRLRGQAILRAHAERAALARVGAEMVATCLFFAAVVRMEFANAQAILQIAPLVVTLVAARTLGESVSRQRYAAIVLGFVGVLIVIRPATSGFNVWSLVVVASVAALVGREFATREVSSEVPITSIALMTAVGNSILAGLLAIAGGWRAVSMREVGLIAAASGLLFFGYLFTIQTVRVGDLSASAPFRYSILFGAVIAGMVFFDEVPDAFTLIGSAVILATGLYSISLDRSGSAPVTTGAKRSTQRLERSVHRASNENGYDGDR